MSATTLAAFIARCRVLCRPHNHVTDAELLRRFTKQRDADAFEQLLERYASLVWGVCRRILTVESDCEDAFQATFLALVRRPGAIDPTQALGAWLHTVAVRVARKMRLHSRRQQPQSGIGEQATAGDVAEEAGRRELCRIVDEEIERLPVAVRAPLILCCLEGRTRDEAAAALGCSVSTVKGRLERGRELLRRRLQQRGVSLPAAFLVLGLTSERIRAALWAKTMQSVLYTPAPALLALADAGVSAMTMGKGKLLLVALLLVSSAAGAVGTLLIQKQVETPASPPAQTVTAEKKAEAPRIRTDRHGDPLPDGAIARLGTVRWRHGFFVFDLAYSPNGKMIAAVGAGRAITLWDAATGNELHRFLNPIQPHTVAFSPDGKMLATTDTFLCRLWDVATGKELRQLKGHTNIVNSAAFAPDGKTLATSSYDGTARIWEANTGKELRQLDCKQGNLFAAVYSPDGKLLATAGKDGTIDLWDAATGKKRRQIGGQKVIENLVFSPDGKCLASWGEEGSIRLWDPLTGKQIRVFDAKLARPRLAMAFSPDSALLALGRKDGTICLWDIASGEEKRRWQAGATVVQTIAFSPDGKTLASGAAWECIRLWDVATGRERHPSPEHRGFVDFVRFSPDGASLVSIGHDHRLLKWDLATQMPHQQFTWTATALSRAALSPDGRTLAVGTWSDWKANLWEVRLCTVGADKPGRLLGKQKGWFCPIAFSPDGRRVASGGKDDHIVNIWDADNGKEVRQITDVKGAVESLCFSPDSTTLACGTSRRGNVASGPRLYLWDVASGKERTHFNNRISESPDGAALAFSPNGKVLASADGHRETSMVRLWNTATGTELCRHTGHGETVGAITFSPDGKLVASGAGDVGYRDNSVHVWEAATGRLIRRFEGHHSCVSSVAFAPDGLTVASGAGDSTILLWDITGRRGDGRWHAKPLTPRQLETYWTALTDADAAKAYDAIWALAAAPEQAVPFLQKHLPPVPRPDAKIVARLIADLDSNDFRVRQKATEELSKLGDAAASDLRRELEGKPSLEVRRRIQELLDQTRDWTAERLRDHRAIQALEHIATQQAKEVLQNLAAGAPGSLRTEEANDALRRWKR